MTDSSTAPFELLGGHEGLARLVNRFYDLMDSEPAFADLRAMHSPDLAPMRSSLTGFLTGWVGGPRDWFDQNPGKCMMSAHAGIGVSAQTADQWLAAMGRSLDDCAVDAALAARLKSAFDSMARGMAATR